ncbi:MAG: Crp/Fnr family transcriptional regulator [Sediminibacterium sp.]|jgi:CRP/FNR family transcriptional regulator|nr:Crp/Fnr family transcriptional regulator [Sediminibacterium sp.]
MIDSNLLLAWGAAAKKFEKGNLVFIEGDKPRFYYQILEGKIRMYHVNEKGKEFTQGNFTEGECFGEPPLIIDETYPACAIATEDTILFKLPKERFFQILKEYPGIQQQFLENLARRIYCKTISTKILSEDAPEHRICQYLDMHKKNRGLRFNEKAIIPLTRKELAEHTGLRIETVIRTLSKLQKTKQIAIIDRKLYY